MYRRFHDRFGTAGLVVAVVALIAALAGTAIAAGGLTAKQKKQVIKIAKKYAGQDGATGATGPAGPAGANGKDGAAGPEGPVGPVGSTGPAGEDGEDGEPGDPWTAGGILPVGATETGAFRGVGPLFVPISFNIPIKESLTGENVKIIASGGTPPAECDDGVGTAAGPLHPEADPGFFCVFTTSAEGFSTPLFTANTATGAAGIGPTGGAVFILGETTSQGTWAVTGF